MPKITGSGASDVRVDPDYIAPPGMDPATALEAGSPDTGLPSDPDEAERVQKERADARADDQEDAQEGEQSSPGTTSSASPPKRKPSARRTKSGDGTPLNAPSTAGPSNATREGSSIASSEGTS